MLGDNMWPRQNYTRSLCTDFNHTCYIDITKLKSSRNSLGQIYAEKTNVYMIHITE